MTGWLRWTAVGFLLVALGWLAGLVLFARSIPRAVENPTRRTDIIVVLTGGSGRLTEGLRLLAARQAKKLFVSGVYRGVDVDELLGLSHDAPEEIACCVVLGHAADDTRGNASETAYWIAGKGYRSIRLVTADYHMPRSLFEFRFLMPQIEVIVNPVFPANIKREQWWLYLGTARLYAEEYSKYLAARLTALFVEPGLPPTASR